MKLKGLISLREIEGMSSPHHGFVKGEMDRRKEALSYVDDVLQLAGYIGGEVGHSEAGKWMIRKEIFPGVNIHYIYERGDEEFSSSLRVLYSGERVKDIPGEDLANFAVAYANHMLRYVRQTNPGKGLPPMCYMV